MTLPDEVWLYILQYLDYPQLFSISQACKHFYRLVNSKNIWKPFGQEYMSVSDSDWNKREHRLLIKVIKLSIKIEKTCRAKYIFEPPDVQRIRKSLRPLKKRQHEQEVIQLKFKKEGIKCRNGSLSFIIRHKASRIIDPVLLDVGQEWLPNLFNVPKGTRITINVVKDKVFTNVYKKF
jgi:hypothetical protein